jgi:hypothetical protein
MGRKGIWQRSTAVLWRYAEQSRTEQIDLKQTSPGQVRARLDCALAGRHESWTEATMKAVVEICRLAASV